MPTMPPEAVLAPQVDSRQAHPALELPHIGLELPPALVRHVPRVSGRRVRRQDGTYELQEVRPKMTPQAEFESCCVVM